MSKWIVVGGAYAERIPRGREWAAYKAGVVLEVDPQSGSATTLVYDDTCPPWLVDKQEITPVYKAATLTDDYAYICSATEIVIFDRDSWREYKRFSSPRLNDAHHVLPSKQGTLWIANTGLDEVIELSESGELLTTLSTVVGEKKKTFDPMVDYRRIASTKPHICHPNFVFAVDADLYVTRFQQKDAICLTSPNKVSYQVECGNIHDGLIRGERLSFTSTNGWITVFDLVSGERIREMNLNELYPTRRPLGWCRGMAWLDDTHVAVGFSRLRPTRFQKNVDWVVRGFNKMERSIPMPTRIVVVDIEKKRVELEVNLEQHGLDAVFSIHNA